MSEKGNPGSDKPPSAAAAHFLTFRFLSIAGALVALSAAGMVPLADFAFCVLSSSYTLFLAARVFPPLLPDPSSQAPVLNIRSRAFRLYMQASIVLGVYLPSAYVLDGALLGGGGKRAGVPEAAAHLFLLNWQGLMEQLTFGGPFAARFSHPAKAFVPIVSHSRRLPALVGWVRAEFGTAAAVAGQGALVWRSVFGRALAAANLAFWSFNLFVVLLVLYLPGVFRSYYGQRKKA